MQSKNNNNIKSIKLRSVQPRYIFLNEDIYNILNIHERSVYEALRFQADYRKESSDIQITIDDLIQISKVKRSMLFYCLDSLENKYFLIRRLNWEKGTFGYTNEYEVAQHLYYFKSNEIEESEENTPDDININGITNGSYIEGVQVVDTVVQEVDTGVQVVDTGGLKKNTTKKIVKQEYKETYYQQNEANKAVLSLEDLFQNNPS